MRCKKELILCADEIHDFFVFIVCNLDYKITQSESHMVIEIIEAISYVDKEFYNVVNMLDGKLPIKIKDE